jgi:hypothetical protein
MSEVLSVDLATNFRCFVGALSHISYVLLVGLAVFEMFCR